MGLQSAILRLFPKYRREHQEHADTRRALRSARREPASTPPANPAAPGLTPPRYIIAKSGTVGIGNRLLFLTGCIVLGKHTGRRVVVDWRDGMFGAREDNAFWSYFEASDELQIRDFAFLEDAPPTDFSRPEWAGALHRDVLTHCRELRKAAGETAPVNGQVLAATGWKYHGFFDAGLSQRILVTYGGKSHLSQFPPKKLAALYPGMDAESVVACLLRGQFRPGPELRTRLAAFVQEYFPTTESRGRVLGVHIRNTDKTPTSSIEDLCARAAAITREIASELPPGAPPPSVFLATDHEPTQTAFRSQFGSRLLVLPKWFAPAATALHYSKDMDAEHKRAVGFEALLDMYLLAACTDQFLQYNSSFSRIAAYLAGSNGGRGASPRLRWHSDEPEPDWEP